MELYYLKFNAIHNKTKQEIPFNFRKNLKMQWSNNFYCKDKFRHDKILKKNQTDTNDDISDISVDVIFSDDDISTLVTEKDKLKKVYIFHSFPYSFYPIGCWSSPSSSIL